MELSYQDFLVLLHEAHPLVPLGLLLLCGYAGGRIANALKAPRVSGYVVAGMILSPSILGIFPRDLVREDFTLITDIALGVIAFSIGGVLELPKVRRLGKQMFWIAVTQALGASIMVTGGILLIFPLIVGSGSSLLANYIPLAIVIGAISAATAPAATLGIVHEYRARGPMTTTLLGVVMLDDALTILFFAFAAQVARSFIAQDSLSVMVAFGRPSLEILVAVIIGGAGGLFLKILAPKIPSRSALLGVGLGTIFLTGGLALSVNSSALLANMVLGFMVTNFVRHSEDLFSVIENVEEPVFGMFFVLAGAHFDLGAAQTAGWLAAIIVVGRFAGKFLGARLGAEISGATDSVKRCLGFGLLPAAGVTVGLVLIAQDLFIDTNISELMVNAVLGSVIVSELLAPLMVRYGLIRSGEAKQPS